MYWHAFSTICCLRTRQYRPTVFSQTWCSYSIYNNKATLKHMTGQYIVFFGLPGLAMHGIVCLRNFSRT